MKVKVFTLAFSPEHNGFDTDEMDAFVDKINVITVTERFFTQNGQPYWALLLSYEDFGSVKPESATVTLSPSQQRLWDMLKTWRMGRATQDKHPAYFILHDRQLVDIVRTIPANVTALRKVRGIGESKAQQYGAEILGVIEQWQKENQASESPSEKK